LKSREGQVAEGRFPGPQAERTRWEELKVDLVRDYKINGRKSLWRVEASLKHLDKNFQGMKAVDITTNHLNRYIEARKNESGENATIVRELGAVRRMFTWVQ